MFLKNRFLQLSLIVLSLVMGMQAQDTHTVLQRNLARKLRFPRNWHRVRCGRSFRL